MLNSLFVEDNRMHVAIIMKQGSLSMHTGMKKFGAIQSLIKPF